MSEPSAPRRPRQFSIRWMLLAVAIVALLLAPFALSTRLVWQERARAEAALNQAVAARQQAQAVQQFLQSALARPVARPESLEDEAQRHRDENK